MQRFCVPRRKVCQSLLANGPPPDGGYKICSTALEIVPSVRKSRRVQTILFPGNRSEIADRSSSWGPPGGHRLGIWWFAVFLYRGFVKWPRPGLLIVKDGEARSMNLPVFRFVPR